MTVKIRKTRKIRKKKNIIKQLDYNILDEMKGKLIDWRHNQLKNNDYRELPTISCVIPSIRINDNYDLMISNMRQSYPFCEWIIVTPCEVNDDVHEKIMNSGIGNIKIIHSDKFDVGYQMNMGITNSSGEIISKMDDDDIYFRNFILDLYLMMKNHPTYPDIVGKRSIFTMFDDEIYIRRFESFYRRYDKMTMIGGGTLLFNRSVWLKSSFKVGLPYGSDREFLLSSYRNGYEFYSTDPFNFIQVRDPYGRNHTWEWDKNRVLEGPGDHYYIGKDMDIVRC